MVTEVNKWWRSDDAEYINAQHPRFMSETSPRSSDNHHWPNPNPNPNPNPSLIFAQLCCIRHKVENNLDKDAEI